MVFSLTFSTDSLTFLILTSSLEVKQPVCKMFYYHFILGVNFENPTPKNIFVLEVSISVLPGTLELCQDYQQKSTAML